MILRKNKPNSNPIQSQFNPKQTQFKPIQTQFKANLRQLLTNPINALNLYDSFLTGCFLALILVKWTFGYEKDKKSKFRTIAGTA